MRFLLEVRIPNESGNRVIRNGTLGPTIQSILADLRAEAAYFTELDGERGGYIVVNVDDASQIPAVAEPLFLAFNATVRFHPVMTPDDLMKAGPAIEQATKKYR